MKKIRKNDRVVLPDGSFGLTMDVYSTSQGRMFKIKRADNEEIQYFDESKIALQKQRLWRWFINLFRFGDRILYPER